MAEKRPKIRYDPNKISVSMKIIFAKKKAIYNYQ